MEFYEQLFMLYLGGWKLIFKTLQGWLFVQNEKKKLLKTLRTHCENKKSFYDENLLWFRNVSESLIYLRNGLLYGYNRRNFKISDEIRNFWSCRKFGVLGLHAIILSYLINFSKPSLPKPRWIFRKWTWTSYGKSVMLYSIN